MMTLTLTPEQERKIKRIAERKQKPAEAVLDDLLAQEPAEPDDDADLAAYVAERRAIQKEKNKPLLELLAQWDAEDEARTDEEKEQDTRDLEELLVNLQANRTRI